MSLVVVGSLWSLGSREFSGRVKGVRMLRGAIIQVPQWYLCGLGARAQKHQDPRFLKPLNPKPSIALTLHLES